MKPFNRVAIIGVGLIGGSVGLGMKKLRLAKKIVGVCRRKSSLNQALKRGAIDIGTHDIKRAVVGCDLVIMATPIMSMPRLIKNNLAVFKKGCILTDVGSTKAELTAKVERIIPKDVLFVGTHPMAGSEKSGVAAARTDLFCGARCIITKTNNTDTRALNTIKQLWRELGADVKILSPQIHDRIISVTSHLPHLVSSSLVLSVPDKNLQFTAGGFKDTTRIALSDPDMWVDICLTNRRQIIKAIDGFSSNLKVLRGAINTRNRKKLFFLLKKARERREKLNKG